MSAVYLSGVNQPPALSFVPRGHLAGRPTVLVIGGGFSGLLAAIHLLSIPDGPRVRLVERGAVVGRGAAYSSSSADHLLNVRVGNMSAFPDDPRHFLDWLAARSGWDARGGFVTRGTFGDYLQELLRTTVATAPAGRLLLEGDEITDLQPAGPGWRATTAMGRSLAADGVVLASGALGPPTPRGADAALLSSSHYIGNPWNDDALATAGQRVLLLGTGLTMIDVAQALARSRRRVWALSRHGLLPREHVDVPRAVAPAYIAGATPLALARALRGASRVAGWRAVIDGYRPLIHRIWQDWPLEERARFLRHLRPWWDVHRHRMAPATAHQIEAMMAAGDLIVQAGRLLSLDLDRDRVKVSWRPRGSTATWHRIVDTVVNCTGQGNLDQPADPLTTALVRRGLVGKDPSGLGLHVDLASRVLAPNGDPQPYLYALGPMTSGAFGEMTSVPDIRRQAMDVAQDLSQRLIQEPGRHSRHG